MKRHLLLFLLVMAMSFGFAATYQIGDGTATQNYVPCYGLYEYSSSKSIYTAAELAAAGLNSPEGLIAIGYEVANSPANYLMEDQFVYIRHTSLTEYDDANMISSDGFTLVYSGNITYNGGGWFYLNFDEPFAYDGTSGIEILWENRYGDWESGYPTFRATTMSNMAAYKYQDNTFPEAPVAGTMAPSRPNIILASPQTTPPNAAVLVAPADGGLVVAESVTLQWADGGGFPTGYKLYAGTSNPPAFVEDLGSVTSYELTNLSDDTTYYWKVEPYSDVGVQTDVPVWSFDANPPGLVIVGEGTAVQRYPFGHLYGFERSAAVYPFEDIGAIGAIESIGWDCTVAGSVPVPYKIYIGTTDVAETTQQLFDDMVEDMVLVSEGEYTFAATGWHMFEFDEPFIYVGGNLLVAVEVNYGGGGGDSTERFTHTTGQTNKHIYWQADNNPPTTQGYRTANRPNIMMQFGELTGDPELSVSPASINFGDAVFGATLPSRNINLSNIGGGSITIAASDVSIVGSPQFDYDSSVFPLVIGSAETLTIPVTLTGTIEGPATATITISYGGEDFDIELSANVLPDGLVVIGDGDVRNYLPINSYYNYSYTQTLYRADEILTEGRQLEKVAYHWNGVAAGINSGDWTIYMGHTDKEAFDTTSDWIDIDELTEVFQGHVDIPAEETWVEIMLHMPFVYSGEDNLVIAVRETAPQNDGNLAFFYTTPSTTGRALRAQSDSAIPDPEEPPNGTLTAAFANIRMYFGDVSEDPVLGYSPESIDFGDAIFGATVGPRNLMIMNQGGGTLDLTANDIEITGANAALFSFDDDVFPVSLETGENVFVPVYVTGTVEGPVSATLIISYAGEENEVELSANILPDGLVIIGEGTANNYMPVNTYYGYSYAQMLYMADEILTEDRQIEKVAYHWNGAGAAPNTSQWTMYMGHTDKEAFDNTTDWIDVDNLTQVYQGFVDIPAENMWIEIELNLPFIYNGEDNLVIAVRESFPGYDSSSYFFYNTPSTVGRSLRCQNDSNIPDPAAPPTGTLTSAHPNIRMYFGDVPDNPVASVFPGSIDFGTIFFNAESDVKNVTVMNAGGGILQLNATDVEITGTNAALFSFDDSGFPFALETAEAGIIPVSLIGTVEGDVEAALEITYGGETFTVELTANVLPDGTIIIGDGTANQRYPFGHLFGYERSAAVYPFEDVGAIGAIESIGWELVTTAAVPVPYKIYMSTIDETETTQQLYDDMIDDMTLVAEGELTFDSLGWNLFELDEPFIYTGGNLLVAVETNYGGTGGGSTERFTYTGGHTNQHIYWQADNNPPATQGYRTALRPNLMLHMGELGGDPELAVNPEAINFGDVIYNAEIGPRNITVSNIGGGSITIAAADVSLTGSAQFSYDDSVFPIVLESAESAAIPVFVTGTIEGPTTAMITIEYDGEDFEIDLSANVLPDGLVVIGDGTVQNYLPVNIWYGYSYSQTLYLTDEILTQDRQIEKVAYHWNGVAEGINSDQWTMYIGHTDKTAFATTSDWIDVDDLTLVYEGIVDIPAENTWIEIEFDTPFVYNGVDNLVIATRETRPGNDGNSAFFYTNPSTTGRSLRCHSDSIVHDPVDPPTGTLTAAHPNIRMYFGDIPADPVLAVSPNVDEWDFGLKPRFSETTKAFTIANNGAGTLTVNNVVVTGDGFALEEAFVATDLASTESVVINVVYNPDEAGDFEGLLAITSSHGSRNIDLIGSCYDPVITEFPFFEGFEVGNTQGSADIAQWEQIIGTEFPTQSWTANSTMTTYNRLPRTGDWNATLRYNGESTLVRPILLEADQEYTLEFWARQDAATGATIRAMLSDNEQFTGDDIIDIVAATDVLSGDYQQFTGEFEVTEGGLYYLGIYGHVTITPWYISLDDISIYEGEIPEDLVPPSYLRASVDGMDVQLEWNAPGDDTPPAGTPQWITWCDVNTYGQNAIGTNGVVVFDVAHRYDANDLAPYQGMALTKMSFVPNQVDCIYTAKVWTGTSAAAPSTLIHSQVLPPPVMNEWNEVIFTNPIPIPATGELWFGYECDTQTGHPAGVDAGPPVAGKGNMMYFNNDWIQLTQAGATLTYNWSIQGFVDNATPPAHARVLRPIHEEPREIILGANFSEANPFAEAASRSDNRAQTGYKVYRDNDLLATINNPGTLTYLDEVTAAGTYSYTVTATYDGGESEPAGPVEVEVEAPAAPIFAITPTSHNFGEVGVGQTASQEFTVSNEGAGTLTINAITISGAMMSLDTLPTLPANLTAGQTLEFTAIYAPTAEGAHTGTITVTDNLTRVAHTVALSGTGVDVGDLYPPVNLQASVVGMDVTLTWDEPVTGDWITWCNPDEVGNAIGTSGEAVFDVAHRFDANDLSPYQGNAITKVGFVPNEANCTYTIKLWAGTSAAAPSTVIHSQVVNSPVIGDWNEVELTTPVGIPPTGELWVGYEANTQTGHPAGCDGGPPIAGKGNMMYFNNQWIQLTDAGATLTYNWLIMSYVD
ncbi:MAG: choice-of-anchor D domain-containing protein, partial [Candidatus Cloacimonadaceae bacterium]